MIGELKIVKRYFFSYRNGVTADFLRKAGSPFRIIFGLTLPQLNEIALRIGKSGELSRLLWKDRSTRCSMLLAPLLMPVEEYDFNEAKEWCSEIPSAEVADVFSLKLLSRTSFAEEIIKELIQGEELQRYIALRTIYNLYRTTKQKKECWKMIARFEHLRENQSISVRLLASQLLEELS